MKAIIIDDEIITVRAIIKRTNWSKYNINPVYSANSMAEAQIIFQNYQPEIMLCDIEMPNGNGLELFEWVKKYYPLTLCIFVTCHPDFTYIRRALVLDSFDYILKPIDFTELDSVLCRAVNFINQHHLQQILENPPSIGETSPIELAISYIKTHIQNSIYVSEIADHVHLTPQYLMRLFKKETGLSIFEFIIKERIEQAKKLLITTDYPITEIALQTGYDNYSYFSHTFKKMTNMTPSAFRKRYAQQ